jgi:Apea-like HEPN
MELKAALENLRTFIADLRQEFEEKSEPQSLTAFEKLVHGPVTIFSSEGLGGMLLTEKDGQRYRHLITDIQESMAQKFKHGRHTDELHVSKGAIESAVQSAILAALDIRKSSPEPFEKRLATCLAELQIALLSKPERWMVHIEVHGLAKEGLPRSFGAIEFYVSDGSLEGSEKTNESKTPAPETNEKASTTLREDRGLSTISRPTKGSVYAKVPVEATDTEAAKSLAERKLRLTLDALNFFGDFFGVTESRVILPGDATVSQVKTFIYSQATHEQHVSLGFRSLSFPFSFESIDTPSANKSGFWRVNSMLANQPASSLDEKILSSIQWAGRASVEVRWEEAFLLFCVSLEALLLSRRTNSEITQTFSLRGAHLLVKDAAHRKEAYDDLKYLYGIRSSIVHSGHTRVAEADLSKIRWLAKTALLIMLVREPFSIMRTEDEFEEWFQTQLLAGTTSAPDLHEGRKEQDQ